jgi:hypothetical protein
VSIKFTCVYANPSFYHIPVYCIPTKFCYTIQFTIPTVQLLVIFLFLPLFIAQRLHTAAIAFLRPLAILYNAITLVPPPESLKGFLLPKYCRAFIPIYMPVPSLDNFVPLCRYLGLPTSLLELFSGREVDRLFKLWVHCNFFMQLWRASPPFKDGSNTTFRATSPAICPSCRCA